MNRRDFLIMSTGAAVSLCGAENILCDDKPLFTFLQLNDTHLKGTIESIGAYANANSRLRWFVEEMNKPEAQKIDFMLFLGDMVVGGKTPETIASQLDELNRNVIKKLPFPVYPCVGNHENKQSQGVEAFEKPYIDMFGKNKQNYTFVRGGIEFVVFDNSGMPPRDSTRLREVHEKLRVELIKWLRQALEANPELPKILCCHIPVACVREEEVLKKSFGFPSYYAHDQELLALLKSHNDSVLAVLSGHLHLTGCVKVDGIYHIVTSGLASYPHDFGIYEVYPDRIDVRMESPPKAMHEPYASNIHNSRRHGIDYTDNDHPEHELYVSGNPDERKFSISLRKK
jgi:3',5'-cyclic AMP phosphodiesterase CpdA